MSLNRKDILNKVRACEWSATLLAIIVVFATACSSESVVTPTPEEKQHAISFCGSQAEDEGVTRSTSLGSLRTSFRVWAYKNYNTSSYQDVIPGFRVNWNASTAYSTTSNTNDWEYVGQEQGSEPEQTIKYWDYGASAYRFFAVAPYRTAPPTLNGNPVESATISIAADASSPEVIAATDYYSELWYSDNNPVNYPNRLFGQPVTLTFLQPYARVRYIFMFTEDGVDRTDITTRSFAPVTTGATIPRKGTVNITYPLLTGTEETFTITNIDATKNLESFDIDYYTEPDDEYKEHWYTVLPIPSSSPQGDYKVAITIFGNNKEAIVPAEFMQWEPGYQYTYKFKIDDSGGIELNIIQVGINDWTVRDVITHPVYNW